MELRNHALTSALQITCKRAAASPPKSAVLCTQQLQSPEGTPICPTGIYSSISHKSDFPFLYFDIRPFSI